MVEFASGYPCNEDGWILFPRDSTLRKEYYPEEVFNHPAKANLYLVQELTRYLTKPGDSIIDPFGGTGTQLISAWEDRTVVLIEIEEQFQNLISGVMAEWARRTPAPTGKMMFVSGDNRQKLKDIQFLCDAAIFSPPYSTALAGSGGAFAVSDSDPD